MRSHLWVVLGTCVLFAACDIKCGSNGEGSADPFGNSPHAENVNVVNCSETYAITLYRRQAFQNVPPVLLGDVGALWPGSDCDDSGAMLNVDLGEPGHMIELSVVYWTNDSTLSCNDSSFEGCRETYFFESVAGAGTYTFKYHQ